MSMQDMKTGVDRLMVTVMVKLDRVQQRFFFKKQEWPVVSGQYYVGRRERPVAICTLSSLDLMRAIGPREEVAIVGKTFTENLGIEKMIRNIVTNPSIRFLVLCGKESPHRVGQTLQALIEHGVDSEGRILESRGPLPQLKNVTGEQIDRFRHQIEVIDLIGEEQIDTILETVDEISKRDPGPFEGSTVEAVSEGTKEVETIDCWHRESQDYEADPAGFFVIQVDADAQDILVEHYSTEFELLRRLRAENALRIYSTIIRNRWVTVLGHAAYLGRELYKAELALKHGWMYEQNKDLIQD